MIVANSKDAPVENRIAEALEQIAYELREIRILFTNGRAEMNVTTRERRF